LKRERREGRRRERERREREITDLRGGAFEIVERRKIDGRIVDLSSAFIVLSSPLVNLDS
jgi:hypothetical protein